MLRRIMSSLSFTRRLKSSLVCKRWYEAAQAPHFLNSTSVAMNAAGDDWDFLGATEKRRIPNLRITFTDGGQSISSEIAHHSRLALNVRHLSLKGDVGATNVIFCLKHFPNLETLEIVLISMSSEFFATSKATRRKLSEELSELPNLTLEVSSMLPEPVLKRLLHCFSSARVFNLRGMGPPFGISRLAGDILVQQLDRLDLVRKLREVDFCFVELSHQTLGDFVKISMPQLRSLKFISHDGNGRNLELLAYSDLTLESLEVECQGQECFDVRYPSISTLLLKKPSLQSFECREMMYLPGRGDNDSQIMTGIVKDWPNLTDVCIKTERGPSTPQQPTAQFNMKRCGKCQVKNLSILHNSPCDKEVIPELAKHSPGLKGVGIGSFESGSKITGIPRLADSLPSLAELELWECDFADVDLSVLGVSNGSRLQSLRSLCLRKCTNITDDDFVGLGFPNLKHLQLTWCKDITDDGVDSVVTCNPHLQLLDLSRCTEITDLSVKSIARYLRHLRCLYLPRCPKITQASASILTENCQMLEYVHVRQCNKVLIDELGRLQGSTRFLRKIELGGARRRNQSIDEWDDAW